MKTRTWIACLILLSLTASLWALSPPATTAVQADDSPRADTPGGVAGRGRLYRGGLGGRRRFVAPGRRAGSLRLRQLADPSFFQTVLEDPDLEHTVAHGNFNDLTFNPYGPTFYDGRLNPFSNTAIREAMNRLIDRTYITQVI